MTTTTQNTDLLKLWLADLADILWRDKTIDRDEAIDCDIKLPLSDYDWIPTRYTGPMPILTMMTEFECEHRYPRVQITLKAAIGDCAVYTVEEL